MRRTRDNFNARKYIAVAKRLGSRPNRIVARWKGSKAGGSALDGPPPFDDNFRQRCQFLRVIESTAKENLAEATQHVHGWQRIKEGEMAGYSIRLDKVKADISSKLKDADGIHCKDPTRTRAGRVFFLVAMFGFEFLITFAALFGSHSMSSQGGQIGFALAVAAALVGLSEYVAQLVRQRPLPPTATRTERRNHDWLIIGLSAVLAVALVFVNLVRAVTAADAISTDHPTHPVFQYALLAIGVCLICICIFTGSSHDYSGPKFGLRALEEEGERLKQQIIGCQTSLKRLDDYLRNLADISSSNINRLFAIFCDHYRRNFMMNQSSGNTSFADRQPSTYDKNTRTDEADSIRARTAQPTNGYSRQ